MPAILPSTGEQISPRMSAMGNPTIVGVDVFCGAGGLTYGLQEAGVTIVAGIDLDPLCEFPFTVNNSSSFIEADVRDIEVSDFENLFPAGATRLLAGCAPCRPFSPFRRGAGKNPRDLEWGLVGEFGRLVEQLKPELVTMENVPDLASKRVFKDLLRTLEALNYHADWRSVYCPPLGIPQHRRRLVLIASALGPVRVPSGSLRPEQYPSVRNAIGKLPKVFAGETARGDRLHKARSLTRKNLDRLRASRPGGTWHDWPKKPPCGVSQEIDRVDVS